METVTNQQLFDKLCEIQNALALSRFAHLDEKSTELWTIHDIAGYLQCTQRTAGEIVKSPYFPQAIYLPSQRNPAESTGGRAKRWFAGEVIRFLRRTQQKG